MTRTLISDLHTHVGKETTVSGWIDVRRDHGKLIFFDLRDRSGTIQVVAIPQNGVIETASMLRGQWVVSIRGKVNQRPEKMVNKDSATGDIELEALEITILSKAAELPFEIGTDLNIDTYLDNLPLTLRTQRARDIFAVQHSLIDTFRSTLNTLGFTEFQAPKLVGDDAEGGAGVFKVEYFKDKNAYLATSPQLYKQIMVGVFERVYATGAQFRAEKHSTTRHLNEIAMLDFEMGFIKDHTDVMAVMERLMQDFVKTIGEKHQEILKHFNVELPHLSEKIPVMKLREAQELIKKETGKDSTKEPDLEPEDERWLCEYARKEWDSDAVFVTHYPVSKRPFYTMEDPEDPGFTKSFDLLFRGVEILSGSQRVHDYETLVGKIKEKGLDPEKFHFYLMAFKYGLPPHGGIGMGLERLTQKFLGLSNVKEASLFPRDMNRIDTLLSE